MLNRIYINAAGEEIRIDTIYLIRKRDSVVKSSLMETGANAVFQREVKTTNLHVSSDRDVVSIQLLGDFDTAETVSGNYLWAAWASPVARVSMNDLPLVGATV